MIAAALVALTLAQGYVPPRYPPFGMDKASYEAVYEQVHKLFLQKVDSKYRPKLGSQEDKCFWALHIWTIATVINFQWHHVITESVAKARSAARDYINDNCNDPNIRSKFMDAYNSAYKNIKSSGQPRDVTAAIEEAKVVYPGALPDCKGVLTTSGVCSPDYRLFIAAVIVVALFIPGPFDDAATAGLIVRLAAP